MSSEHRAQAAKESATIYMEPSFSVFNTTEVKKVNANWEAPNKAEAIPDSALNGDRAKVVDVGNNIPKGNTKKNRGTNW